MEIVTRDELDRLAESLSAELLDDDTVARYATRAAAEFELLLNLGLIDGDIDTISETGAVILELNDEALHTRIAQARALRAAGTPAWQMLQDELLEAK
jgi:hypothetical protein